MKKIGTSTCTACPFKVKDDVYHFQKFQRHLKSSNHPMEQAWYCKNYNCKKRSFKLGGLRTCSEKKPYFRLEDQNDHVSESESSLQEINKISSSIREVNCALDKLIETYNFSDFKSLNRLKIGEEINSHTEMLDTAKNIVKKIEKINQYVSHMGKGGNSDKFNYPAQSINSPSDSQNKAVEIILGV